MLRVVSLLPSATEMLACIVEHQPKGRLGQVQLVGRSHECDFPRPYVDAIPTLTSQKTHFDPNSANPAKDIDEQVRKALSSGNSLYNLDTDKLQELMPDVVLTQSLCEVCSIDLVTVERVVKRLKMPCNVIDLNPKTLGDILRDIERVGEAIGCEEGASQVISALTLRIERAESSVSTNGKAKPNIAFIEWTDPIFIGGHWTPEIIHRAGAIHPLNSAGAKSITVTDTIIADSDPDAILISPCGMSLEKTRELVEMIQKDPIRGPWFLSLRAVKNNKVALVDGNEMFNRPGPRLVDALEFCSALVQSFGTLNDAEPFPASLPGCPKGFPWAPL